MNEEQRIKELALAICNNPKYARSIFEASCIYFAICEGDIYTISNDASCSPRGGWFPAIVSHPSPEKEAYLDAKMDELGFDYGFFEDALSEYDPDDVECYFEDQEDEDSVEICRKLEEEINEGNTPFYSLGDLVRAVKYIDLDDDLYYEWEGDLIPFYDNIIETGKDPGYFDGLSPADWINILENIDNHIVTAD